MTSLIGGMQRLEKKLAEQASAPQPES
jgi:hypothetical protein